MKGVRRAVHIIKHAWLVMLFSYVISGYMSNSYRLGWMNKAVLSQDKSFEALLSLKRIDKYNRAMVHLLLKSGNEVECRQLDALDWLLLANHMKELGEDELSLETYYMAHLKDHARIKANSELA
eukprot:CAMPEP_0168332390 /NCGR_PEP_ID=MMETSP0213-20121227/8929_1 /TAXON_ID=151035 /ORGANISM="Euplotes harpa, Strain FSP1.4" /LENGTH=123 /DNA_ID=CAMNT_0008336405 /DNA_START=213 /DNA_END=580 /DNA_ORIENTATION=+